MLKIVLKWENIKFWKSRLCVAIKQGHVQCIFWVTMKLSTMMYKKINRGCFWMLWKKKIYCGFGQSGWTSKRFLVAHNHKVTLVDYFIFFLRNLRRRSYGMFQVWQSCQLRNTKTRWRFWTTWLWKGNCHEYNSSIECKYNEIAKWNWLIWPPSPTDYERILRLWKCMGSVKALYLGSSGLGSSTGQGYCVLFLNKTLAE